MGCDLCAKDEFLRLARIEGTAYKVCSACAELGEVIVTQAPRRERGARGEPDLAVRGDAGAIIRSSRERSGKTHRELARELQVKESELHAWETGSRLPTVETAKTLERRLKVDLLEQIEGGHAPSSVSGTSEGFTIADLLKKKR